MSIHIATLEDARFMFEFGSGKTEADRLTWATESLNDPRHFHLIGAVAGKPAALLSVRDDEDGSLAIAISVTRSQSKDIGTQMLQQVSDMMQGLSLSVAAWRQKAAVMKMQDSVPTIQRPFKNQPA